MDIPIAHRAGYLYPAPSSTFPAFRHISAFSRIPLVHTDFVSTIITIQKSIYYLLNTYPFHIHMFFPFSTQISYSLHCILLNARNIFCHSSHLYIYQTWIPKFGRRSRGKVKRGHHLQTPLLRTTTNRGQEPATTAISHAPHLQIVCQVPSLNQSSSPDKTLRRNQKGSLTTIPFVSLGLKRGLFPPNLERKVGKSGWFDRRKCHAVQTSLSSGQEYMSRKKIQITFSTLLLITRRIIASVLLHGILT
jgi:hypothetical protein